MVKKKDNPGSMFVTRAECKEVTNSIKAELETIRTALVGKDMRGGIVKDVSDLKKERSTTLDIAKSVVLPIIIAVATAWIVSGLPH